MSNRELPTLPKGFQWEYNPTPPSESIHVLDVEEDKYLYTFTPRIADKYSTWRINGEEGLRKVREHLDRFNEESGWEAAVNRANNPKESND